MGRHDHCSCCGHRYPAGAPWPRLCAACGETTWLNPLPVSVVLLPVGKGLLTVRRSIPPRRGELALPGGFITCPESWQEAGARELLEETGIAIEPSAIAHFQTVSSDDGHILVFGLAPGLPSVPSLLANEEVSELVVADAPLALAFPTHTQAMEEFFRRHGACS